jgi:hypothetical protein
MDVLGPNLHVRRPSRCEPIDLFEKGRIQAKAFGANYEFGAKFVSSILPNLNYSDPTHTIGRIKSFVGWIEAGVAEKGQVLEVSRYRSNSPDCIRQVTGAHSDFSDVNFACAGAINRQDIHSALSGWPLGFKENLWDDQLTK